MLVLFDGFFDVFSECGEVIAFYVEEFVLLEEGFVVVVVG